jgi:Ferritin-like
MSSTRRTAAAVSAMHIAEDTTAELILETREELINGLTEAAELEHGLLLQYLFAALTTKKRPTEGLTEAQVELVRDWGREILRVAREEMAHLGTVCNLLTAIGGAPHFSRPNFPQSMQRWYPFDFQLERLTEDTLKRFVLFEQPVSERMAIAALAIAPDPIVYNRVGELYRAIKHGLQLAETRLRGQRQTLFIGPKEAQDSDDWTARLNLRQVTDLASAQAAVDFIIIEGEGAPDNRQGSHYQTFVDMLTAFRREREVDPAFDPARPVVLNPATREHRDAGPGFTLLQEGTEAHAVAELFNVVYTTMLLMLMQFYDFGDETSAQRAALQAGIRQSMSAIIRPLVEVLSELPAGENSPGRNAGPGFELYGDLRLPSHASSRWVVLIERIRTATVECRRLFNSGSVSLSRLGFIARNMELLANNIAAVS